MCIGKGMIIVKGQDRPEYNTDSNDHAPIIERLQLTDNKLVDRNFVRIELLPTGNLFSQNVQEWEYKEDETETLPSWYEELKKEYQYRCLEILTTGIIPQWKKEGVGGDLDLRDTQIKELPESLEVGGDIHKDF